jgi:ribonuclease VapC
MIVDTSAIIAILRKEPDQERYLRAVISADVAWISSVNLLELYAVLALRADDVSRLIEDSDIKVWDFTWSTAVLARDAFIQYGKGRHKASLNICDCAAYATAKEAKLPLLYKGNDFAHTDIESPL